jgi:hypothetical protein
MPYPLEVSLPSTVTTIQLFFHCCTRCGQNMSVAFALFAIDFNEISLTAMRKKPLNETTAQMKMRMIFNLLLQISEQVHGHSHNNKRVTASYKREWKRIEKND